MIALLERTGDRLLSLVVPGTTATAHHCYYTWFCDSCPGGLRPCKWHCCNPGGCVLVSCVSGCGPC